jgi:hypothetical protein
LVSFHTKRFSKNKSDIPNEDELKTALYRYEGWALDIKKFFFGFPAVELYDEKHYKKLYLDHISDVKKYFSGRQNDLLLLNVSENNSYQSLASFLDIKIENDAKFPWLNKT